MWIQQNDSNNSEMDEGIMESAWIPPNDFKTSKSDNFQSEKVKKSRYNPTESDMMEILKCQKQKGFWLKSNRIFKILNLDDGLLQSSLSKKLQSMNG